MQIIEKPMLVESNLVALCPSRKIPRMGEVVFIGNRRIGRVSDIIGSVEKPYVVVKLTRKDRDVFRNIYNSQTNDLKSNQNKNVQSR